MFHVEHDEEKDQPIIRENALLMARKMNRDGSRSFRKIAMPDGAGGWHPFGWATLFGTVMDDNWWSKSADPLTKRTLVMVEELPAGENGALILDIRSLAGHQTKLTIGTIPIEPPRRPSDMSQAIKPSWDYAGDFARVSNVRRDGGYKTRVELHDGRVFEL